MSTQPGAASGRPRLVSPVLVGRARELEILTDARSSSPAVLVVEGEAGIGKSRLIAELVEHTETTVAARLVGRCHRIRAPFPLGSVIEALRSLGPDVGGLNLSPLAGALRPVLPELADRLPPGLEPFGDQAAEQHRVFRALVEVLAALGDALVVLEDLHWADDLTTEFLRFLLAEQPRGLQLVLSYRGEEVSDALRGLTARLPPSTARSHIELAPLDTPATGELAAAILDIDDISTHFVAHLRERTGGLPFAIEEVLATLRERREAVPRRGKRARRTLEGMKVPGAIRDSVLERVGRLSAEARTVLEAAAVLEVAVPHSVVLATSGVDEHRARVGLSEAVRSGFLTEHEERDIRFRHVLAGQAVEEALPGQHRRELNARAGEALAQLETPPLGQLAHHLWRAGNLEQWVHRAEQAADQATELGDDGGAANLLIDVLSEASLDPARRIRIALKLARAALYGVAHEDALDLLTRVVDADDLPRADRGELRRGVAQLLAQAGDELAAHDQFAIATSELAGRPASQARAMAALAVLNVPGAQVEQQVRWADRALAVLETVQDPVAETVVLGNRTIMLLSTGDRAWRSGLEPLRREAASVEHERVLARVGHSVAITACFTGHLRDADVLLGEASRRLEVAGYELMEQALRSARAAIDFSVGYWDGLEEAVDTLCDDLADLPVHRVDAEWVAGCLRLARGDLAGARRRLEVALDLGSGLTFVEGIAPAAGALARLHLSRGDPSEAVACAMRCISAVRSKNLWTPAGPAVRWAVEALVGAGGRAEAHTLCERFQVGLTDRDAPAGAAALDACRGVLAEAEDRPAEAAGFFLAAAAAYARLPCPYEAAQANERAAVCLFRAEDGRAPTTLRTALDAFENLGASWDAARTSRTARRHGLNLPVPYRGGRRGYGSELSPRERDVAELAAAGLSNREIAAELFLSTRTVDKHLSRALRKVGVASRRDLRHLREHPPAPTGGETKDG